MAVIFHKDQRASRCSPTTIRRHLAAILSTHQQHIPRFSLVYLTHRSSNLLLFFPSIQPAIIMKFFAVITLVAATAMAGAVPRGYQWISHNDRSGSGLSSSHAQNTCGTNNVKCCQGFSPEHGLSRQDESRFRAGLGEGVPGELQGGNNCGPCKLIFSECLLGIEADQFIQ